MTCDDVATDDVVERYLDGTLPGEEREAFEQHFFSCRACLERLELLQGLPSAIAQVSAAPASSHYSMWAMAACLLLAVSAGVVWKTQTEAPAPAQPVAATPPPAALPDPLMELAKFEPPKYDPSEFRSSRTPAIVAFQSGMAKYREGAFAESAIHLARAAELNPADPGAAFFLGISRLLAGEIAPAIESLRKVDAMGLTPYQEEARFYLAKAYLRQSDAQSARDTLLAIEKMNGDLAAQARALRDRLDSIHPNRN